MTPDAGACARNARTGLDALSFLRSGQGSRTSVLQPEADVTAEWVDPRNYMKAFFGAEVSEDGEPLELDSPQSLVQAEPFFPLADGSASAISTFGAS